MPFLQFSNCKATIVSCIPQPDLYVLQIFTSFEYIHAIFQRYGDTFQRGAVIECPIFNCFQLITKFHIGQVFTTIECVCLDDLDRWQEDAHQRCADSECTVSDSSGFTIFECPFLNSFDTWHFYSFKEGQPQNASLSILSALRQSTSTMLGCRWNARSGMTLTDLSTVTWVALTTSSSSVKMCGIISPSSSDGTAARFLNNKRYYFLAFSEGEERKRERSCERADFRFSARFFGVQQQFQKFVSRIGTKDFFRSAETFNFNMMRVTRYSYPH
jgi:hypothetical protein